VLLVDSRLTGEPDGDPGLVRLLVGDGRPLIALFAVCLALAGGFAIFQSLAGHFLPHDVAYLGLSPSDLCVADRCRVVAFMFHDRVAFGGTLIAIGTLYLWLAAVPLRSGQGWAWWVLAASGLVGFASFLAYLGYGYLDTWHGVATLALLPLFLGGLARIGRGTRGPAGIPTFRAQPAMTTDTALEAVGHGMVLLAAAGTTLAGMTVLAIGTTTVFVPQDLTFMDHLPSDLETVSPRLIPLIAHDRAGFGGGLATTGIAALGIAWFAERSRSAW
jgi:hypothetical protein